MQRLDGLDTKNFYIGSCKLTDEQKELSYNNPHCIEYFCNYKNIKPCTKCGNYLINKKNIDLWHKDLIKDDKEDETYCKNNCNNGFIYDYVERPDDKHNTFHIDKYKTKDNFYNNNLIYKLSDLPYKLDYENTFPKPKSVVHWGQVKMLLVITIFFMNKIDPKEKEVHIVYAGSARGDNILILCDMFPNTYWYLVDPRKHHNKLYKHKQIKEIKQAYFTDEIAEYYHNKFKNRKHKLLFMSDIREETDDYSVLEDQEMNINWHKIIKPDFSYLKFRCGYESDKIYKYYKGTIYLQIYAPSSSTETRILLPNELEPCEYDIEEYQGKLLYFNRVIRPSYHTNSIIKNNDYFDHCYDCTYFSYIIKNYLKKFKSVNPFKTHDIFKIMKNITTRISKYTYDKIDIHNKHFRNNIIQ